MTDGPEPTAVRVALWRAMHVQHDGAPHVIEGRPAVPASLRLDASACYVPGVLYQYGYGDAVGYWYTDMYGVE